MTVVRPRERLCLSTLHKYFTGLGVLYGSCFMRVIGPVTWNLTPGLHDNRRSVAGYSSSCVDFNISLRAGSRNSTENRDEFKECFNLYDKKGKGKIPAQDLLTVMRCLGTCPTPAEVTRHLQVHKIGKDGELEFSTFLTIMYRQQKQEDPENEILVAMLMTDRQKKGLIPLAELKAKLCRMGEKLTPEEVDDLFRDAEVGPDGMVKYEDFVRKMTLPLPDY
ncbi:calmodulin-like protein 4 isoform X2 [Hyla sarda]|uniref:calmodulin-like protein 4 isoform X2 n=1 Tax=Hyla sarda TaxID=327740 RepID=UPI0024C444EE|nr:calmodulin-like protein 4 isoform X2 [Hyla sarda]